jgi:hypothetical protein
MEMQMKYRLAGIGAAIDDYAIAALGNAELFG